MNPAQQSLFGREAIPSSSVSHQSPSLCLCAWSHKGAHSPGVARPQPVHPRITACPSIRPTGWHLPQAPCCSASCYSAKPHCPPPHPPLHAYSVPISLWGKQPEEITVSQAFGTSSVRGEATHVTAGMVYNVGRRELDSGLADTDGERQGETGVPGRRHSVESHGSRTNRVALSL